MVLEEDEQIRIRVKGWLSVPIDIDSLIGLIPLLKVKVSVYLEVMDALINKMVVQPCADQQQSWAQLTIRIAFLGLQCKIPPSALLDSHLKASDHFRHLRSSINSLIKSLHLYSLFSIPNTCFSTALIVVLDKINIFAHSLEFYEALRSILRKSNLSLVVNWVQEKLNLIKAEHKEEQNNIVQNMVNIFSSEKKNTAQQKTVIQKDPLKKRKSRNVLKIMERWSRKNVFFQKRQSNQNKCMQKDKKQSVDIQIDNKNQQSFAFQNNIQNQLPKEGNKTLNMKLSLNQSRNSLPRTLYNRGKYIFRASRRQSEIDYFYLDETGKQISVESEALLSNNQSPLDLECQKAIEANDCHPQIFSQLITNHPLQSNAFFRQNHSQNASDRSSKCMDQNNIKQEINPSFSILRRKMQSSEQIEQKNKINTKKCIQSILMEKLEKRYLQRKQKIKDKNNYPSNIIQEKNIMQEQSIKNLRKSNKKEMQNKNYFG